MFLLRKGSSLTSSVGSSDYQCARCRRGHGDSHRERPKADTPVELRAPLCRLESRIHPDRHLDRDLLPVETSCTDEARLELTEVVYIRVLQTEGESEWRPSDRPADHLPDD